MAQANADQADDYAAAAVKFARPKTPLGPHPHRGRAHRKPVSRHEAHLRLYRLSWRHCSRVFPRSRSHLQSHTCSPTGIW
jgi:hypothetical protein